MITTINEWKRLNESKETMTFWHGGNLDRDFDSHKSGQWEYGPGLYLTTQYDVVQKYARGSRKLYKITVEKGVNINDVYLPLDIILNFVNMYIIKSKKNDVLTSINNRQKDNKLNVEIFLNIIINNNAIKNSQTSILKDFFVNNGIDYSLVYNAFGWGETMMILFNMKKIVSSTVFNSKDRLDDYNFPKNFIKSNI